MSSSALQQMLLRSLCFVYLWAFLAAYYQNDGLVGDEGLLPVNAFLSRVATHHGVNRAAHQTLQWPLLWDMDEKHWNAFKSTPSILWWAPIHDVDRWMNGIGKTGVTLSAAVLVTGRANMFVMLLLWVCYMSIVSVGQSFYSFGWESQMLETGLIGVFLTRPVSFLPMRRVPWVVIAAYRWLLFRVMFGAGMIKLRGDSCWLDMTCMHYHYQTQPNPNPLSALFHGTSADVHAMEVWVNHFVELVVPFFAALPQPAAAIGGFIHIAFMGTIICSGNLAFLNWLTMVPALACFSESQASWLCRFWPLRGGREEGVPPTSRSSKARISVSRVFLGLVHLVYACTVVYLSIPVAKNLFAASGQQVMNTNYDWLRMVNTYGNFGSITRVRNEVIIEGRSRLHPKVWKAYEFVCKPGHVQRRPCLVSPYHYRLDWLMWFAAFQRLEHNPWLVHLAYKMLVAHKDPAARQTLLSLGVEDPFVSTFDDGTAAHISNSSVDHPTVLRMTLIEYRFDPRIQKRKWETVTDVVRSLWSGNRTLPRPYWTRVGRGQPYMNDVEAAQLKPFVQQLRG